MIQQHINLPLQVSGLSGGSRTHGLLFPKQALCQLSYTQIYGGTVLCCYDVYHWRNRTTFTASITYYA